MMGRPPKPRRRIVRSPACETLLADGREPLSCVVLDDAGRSRGAGFPVLGIVTKGFFASEVGDIVGEIKPVPAVLFYLLHVADVLIFVSGPAVRDLAVDACLRRGVRPVLFRDLRSHLAGADQALDLGGRGRRRVLGRGRERDRRECAADRGECDHAEGLSGIAEIAVIASQRVAPMRAR